MSLKNKTKQIKWCESHECVCRLHPVVTICNNKQEWNRDRCRCECLVNKRCVNNFVFNPTNSKCEYKKNAAHLLI